MALNSFCHLHGLEHDFEYPQRQQKRKRSNSSEDEEEPRAGEKRIRGCGVVCRVRISRRFDQQSLLDFFKACADSTHLDDPTISRANLLLKEFIAQSEHQPTRLASFFLHMSELLELFSIFKRDTALDELLVETCMRCFEWTERMNARVQCALRLATATLSCLG